MGLATRCNCDRPEPELRQSMAPALENSSGLFVRQGQRFNQGYCFRKLHPQDQKWEPRGTRPQILVNA